MPRHRWTFIFIFIIRRLKLLQYMESFEYSEDLLSDFDKVPLQVSGALDLTALQQSHNHPFIFVNYRKYRRSEMCRWNVLFPYNENGKLLLLTIFPRFPKRYITCTHTRFIKPVNHVKFIEEPYDWLFTTTDLGNFFLVWGNTEVGIPSSLYVRH